MKKILLLLTVCLLTGCSVDYKIDIDKNVIEETTNIVEINNFNSIAYDNKTTLETFKYFFENPVATNYKELDFNHLNVETSYQKYTVDFKEKTDKLLSNYNNKFEYKDYGNSTMAYTCYKKFSAILEDKLYYISTGKQNDCFKIFPLLENINITVTSKYKIVNHNADEYNASTGEYKWKIEKSNPNRQISMTIDTSKNNDFRKGFIYYLKEYPLVIILLLSIILIGAISIIVTIIKIRKNNRI